MDPLWDLDGSVIDRAVSDPVFRRALIEDPRAAIESAFGVRIPTGVSIEVHENRPDSIHLVLPPERDEFSSADTDLALYWERFLRPR